ncbi:helix-turn-helix domain-containing protein [Nocardiopsis changdeensis]|uniref:Helix-turn-helix domain-containing protein n=1 Tax=Nocardiopsis changdeensis TaxID=2831969 RepID=A0ABX8BPR4_9ACTN|nr:MULTISPECIES: helix-turn-helix transcriptional regulator [Nocardiopsis]QUX23249.1 helix-turn-helix domain-containing protein [Nocardiopsis changdeensis]QYX39191.1 helix-turn-helix domain-containing protein [Nocardiopsis sp. MT53]
MAVPESFHQDRAELADRLRRLRAVSGMSGTRVAELLDWSQSKVSKIETGRVTPSGDDVRSLLDLYRPQKDERVETEELARALNDRYRSLRMLRKRGLHRTQEDIGRRTRQAQTVRSFQPTMVPGLLQTPEYARAVFSQPLSSGGTDVAEAVRARMERQTILFDPRHSFHFVITEAALRWRLGSAATMRAQMDRLANLSTAENLRIGFLPWNVPVAQVPKNGFVILDEEEVSVESFTTHRNITEPRDVRFHLDVFRLFADAAVYDDEARTFLAELAREHS